MTVKELIEKLQTYDPDLEVIVDYTPHEADQEPLKNVRKYRAGSNCTAHKHPARNVLYLTAW